VASQRRQPSGLSAESRRPPSLHLSANHPLQVIANSVPNRCNPTYLFSVKKMTLSDQQRDTGGGDTRLEAGVPVLTWRLPHCAPLPDVALSAAVRPRAGLATQLRAGFRRFCESGGFDSARRAPQVAGRTPCAAGLAREPIGVVSVERGPGGVGLPRVLARRTVGCCGWPREVSRPFKQVPSGGPPTLC
jgi:hypothetical protein